LRRLLIRPGGIGDCILSLPALEFLRTGYTEVWVPGPVVPLIRFADRVRAIAGTGLDLIEIPGQRPAATVEALRGFDEIVSWYGSGRPEFREAVEELRLHFRFLAALPDEPGVHASDFYVRQVGARASAPRIPCPRLDGGYAVIHPFSGSAAKNWPLERFQELAGWLGARLPLHWCAGPQESLPGAHRFEDLYDLGCWLAGARVYIGNDSGITHLAAAAGAPVVALFGPTDPEVWGPRGDRVRMVHTPAPGEPMQKIQLAGVRAGVESLW